MGKSFSREIFNLDICPRHLMSKSWIYKRKSKDHDGKLTLNFQGTFSLNLEGSKNREIRFKISNCEIGPREILRKLW